SSQPEFREELPKYGSSFFSASLCDIAPDMRGLRGFEPEQARREGGGKRPGWARQPAEAGWKELAGSKVLEAKS
ncbi:MAG: hypothetical protein ACOZCE_05300, partial [Spirochaetota bacterium]